MGHIAKEHLTDCSTSKEFCFSLRCEECKKVWKSTPIRFSKAGIRPETDGKRIVFDTLYRREMEEARARAVKEAEKTFSRCPICHRMVCDRCFKVCDDLDMCVSCAKWLEEHGEPVVF